MTDLVKRSDVLDCAAHAGDHPETGDEIRARMQIGQAIAALPAAPRSPVDEAARKLAKATELSVVCWIEGYIGPPRRSCHACKKTWGAATIHDPEKHADDCALVAYRAAKASETGGS